MDKLIATTMAYEGGTRRQTKKQLVARATRASGPGPTPQSTRKGWCQPTLPRWHPPPTFAFKLMKHQEPASLELRQQAQEATTHSPCDAIGVAAYLQCRYAANAMQPIQLLAIMLINASISTHFICTSSHKWLGL